MCRFKLLVQTFDSFIYKFQYILCVGSRNPNEWDMAGVAAFQYILCVGSSIQYISV